MITRTDTRKKIFRRNVETGMRLIVFQSVQMFGGMTRR